MKDLIENKLVSREFISDVLMEKTKLQCKDQRAEVADVYKGDFFLHVHRCRYHQTTAATKLPGVVDRFY
jgi:hypothetical protein